MQEPAQAWPDSSMIRHRLIHLSLRQLLAQCELRNIAFFMNGLPELTDF